MKWGNIWNIAWLSDHNFLNILYYKDPSELQNGLENFNVTEFEKVINVVL